jgi:hypothetical protein
MGWPLTGNSLVKFNRLLDDLRQYGDFPFVGSPDDITWLQETIVAASDGALNPPLDDVANRSHYWTLRLVSFLGSNISPPCPPCPPCPSQSGFVWGPDETTLNSFHTGNSDALGVTSWELPALVTILNFLTVIPFGNLTPLSFSAPRLKTVGTNILADQGQTPGFSSWSLPELETVGGAFILYNHTNLSSLNLPKLKSVGDAADFVDGADSLISVSFPSLETAGDLYAAYGCPNLTSISYPAFKQALGNKLVIYNCPLLTTVSFPSFISSNSEIDITFNGIVDLSLPSFVPINGIDIFVGSNSLNAASVNHILARAVANPAYVSGTIDLANQTPSQPPTGQGVLDVTTLQNRGVTVLTD